MVDANAHAPTSATHCVNKKYGSATKVDGKARLHLHHQNKHLFDNATMVDAKAHLPLHLFNLQTPIVTTPQWWMLRPTYP